MEISGMRSYIWRKIDRKKLVHFMKKFIIRKKFNISTDIIIAIYELLSFSKIMFNTVRDRKIH